VPPVLSTTGRIFKQCEGGWMITVNNIWSFWLVSLMSSWVDRDNKGASVSVSS
jgi:hypothetical protein